MSPPRPGRPLLLAAGALALAVATMGGRGRSLDHRVLGWVNGRLRHPSLDVSLKAVTELGSLWASAAAAGALAARGRRREAADALGAATVTWGLGQLLKRGFRRARPYEAELPSPLRLLIARPAGASWPSSHPAVVLTFLTVAARDLRLGDAARSRLALIPAVIGGSRVYLGVHYPADVLGGLLIGRAVADAWTASVSPRVLD